jgi:hypothetical protein
VVDAIKVLNGAGLWVFEWLFHDSTVALSGHSMSLGPVCITYRIGEHISLCRHGWYERYEDHGEPSTASDE